MPVKLRDTDKSRVSVLAGSGSGCWWGALASCLDSAGEEYNHDFGILADAVALLLTRHDTTRDRGPNPRTEAEMRAREARKRGLSDAVLAAAHEAGVELGQKFTDYRGRETGPCAPAPSRLARLRALG